MVYMLFVKSQYMNEQELTELNNLMAEIMGWKAKHREDKCDGVNIIKCGACGAHGHANCYGDGTGAIQLTCLQRPCCEEADMPNFVYELDASMMVLEKCHSITVFPILTGVKSDGHYCVSSILGKSSSFECPTVDKMKGYPSLPLAICLFARKLFSK